MNTTSARFKQYKKDKYVCYNIFENGRVGPIGREVTSGK